MQVFLDQIDLFGINSYPELYLSANTKTPWSIKAPYLCVDQNRLSTLTDSGDSKVILSCKGINPSDDAECSSIISSGIQNDFDGIKNCATNNKCQILAGAGNKAGANAQSGR